MAKNLKINIKNTQLAEALNLGELKSKLQKKKEQAPAKPKKEAAPETTAQAQQPVVEEEPRRIKARAKSSPAPSLKRDMEREAQELQAQPPAQEEEIVREEPEVVQQPPVIEEPEPHVEPQIAKKPEPVVQEPEPPKEPVIETKHKEESREHRPLPPALRPAESRWISPRSQQTRESSSSPPRPKLGPTGRHVKDLLRPRPPRPPSSPSARESRGPTEQRPFDRRRPVGAPPQDRNLPRQTPSAAPTEERSAPRKTAKMKEFRDLKPLKKQDMRTFDARDRQGLRQGEDEYWRKKRTFKPKHQQEDTTIRPSSLKIRMPISIKDLAEKMKLKASQLIAKLFMQGVIITLNDYLDDETTIQLLGQEFGCEITIDTSEEERIRVTDKTIAEEIVAADSDTLQPRAPVVTFMGHVDHGKTSLIDAIRKSDRISQEAGAITQHIGAFRCHTPVGDLTILDTPGHEAFAAMRSRGAKATDIVVLVIAGDEGMRQQTIEAMNQAKEAGVTIVVAINKADKPGFNAENVYKQLSEHELLPEAWGGTTITVNCSAVTKQGINELLDMLALQSEMLELKASPSMRARGTVLESEMHKGLGAVATVLVQNGTLHLGDSIVFGQLYGRIKTMHDEHGRDLKEAGPSTPVEITGLSGLPEAGQEFIVVKNEKEAREIAEARLEEMKETALQQSKRISLEKLTQQKSTQEVKVLNVILKADVQGSAEALKASLLRIQSKKVEINVVSTGVGEISESDVQLAAASQAVIIGFHTQIESHAETLIKQMKVTVNVYDVIYHAIEGVRDIMTNMLDKIEQEKDTGSATVKALFKSSQLGTIAGCMVDEGTITRNNKIRVVRNKEVIWKGGISSLKRVKEDVREVKKGFECGILLNGFSELQVDDELQAYEVIYLTQEL